MFCQKCGNQLADHAAFCPNCGSMVGADAQTENAFSQPVNDAQQGAQNGQQWGNAQQGVHLNGQQYESTTQGKHEKKKNSGLSTAAALLSIFGCTAIIGLILAIVDLVKNKDDGKKHTGSYFAIIITVVYVVVLIAASGGNTNDSKSTQKAQEAVEVQQDENQTDAAGETETAPEIDETIEYTAVHVSQMMNDLNSNAMKAQETYMDQYLEITGKLSNIDASGSYISLTDENDEYAIVGVQCYIKGDAQKSQVMNMKDGDMITLRGICTQVGEVMGYSLDIHSIDGYDEDTSAGESDNDASGGAITCTASEMVNDLNENAMKAQGKYKDCKVVVTGKLSNIDASGEYISIEPEDDPYSFTSIQCYIQSDNIKNKVMDLSIGDTVTITGQCIDVGEVLGYSINIEEIE